MQFRHWHWPLPNLTLGVSVENQAAADERIPLLLQTPAARRFLSVEPMLGALQIIPYLGHNAYRCECGWHDTEMGLNIFGYNRDTQGPKAAICHKCGKRADIFRALDWVICGGESGPGARPLHPDWARGLRDQCAGAGVPFFFKQWGQWEPDGNQSGHNVVVGRGDNGGSWVGDKFRHGVYEICHQHMKRVGKARAGRLLDGQRREGMAE
jgi:hypothetical protein